MSKGVDGIFSNMFWDISEKRVAKGVEAGSSHYCSQKGWSPRSLESLFAK